MRVIVNDYIYLNQSVIFIEYELSLKGKLNFRLRISIKKINKL
jgi:hypothetical protein